MQIMLLLFTSDLGILKHPRSLIPLRQPLRLKDARHEKMMQIMLLLFTSDLGILKHPT